MSLGLSFSETMSGYVQRGHQPADDFAGGERAGRAAGADVEFDLDMHAADFEEFIEGERHSAVANGRIHVAGFTGEGKVPVENGEFNLFVATAHANERRMLYALPFWGQDGKPYLLDGYKEVKDHGSFDVWKSTTTLYSVVRAGHSRDGEVLATGIIGIHWLHSLKLVTTLTITGTDDPFEKARALQRFGRVYAGTLWDVFVKQRGASSASG